MPYFGDENHARWLHAFADSAFEIFTFSQCMTLASGEDGHQLVLADFKSKAGSKPKLKTFSGTLIIGEQLLPDIPAGVVAFPVDRQQSMPSGIGAACGSEILVYRNNKPFYKYSLPKLPISDQEQTAWRRLYDAHTDDIPNFVDQLHSVPFEELTTKSQTLLNLPKDLWETFINENKNVPLERKTVVTAITTLPKKVNDSQVCIVVGTEHGDIMIIDPQGFTLVYQARICSTNVTPFKIACYGHFDVQFRCIIGCREGLVCVLKRGWLEGNILFSVTDSSIIDFVLMPDDLSTMVLTDNSKLLCYSKKGRMFWSLALPSRGITLTVVTLKHFNSCLTAVSLKGGAVFLYKGRKHVDTIMVSNTVGAMTFGPLGQEDNVLILITVDGTLLIKILKRTADYNENISSNESSNCCSQAVKPLAIPKKSKLFVEQTNRERQHATEIHRVFQQELCRLRLLAARTTAKFIKTSEVSIAPIKLYAQVLGLGPTFTLTISIISGDTGKVLTDLAMIFHVSATAYSLTQSYINLPTLYPGINYTFNTKIIENQPNNWNDDGDVHSIDEVPDLSYTPLKIFIVRKGESQPISASKIQLPLTERML